MKFTILGGSGFIGSHLSEAILGLHYECESPSRDDRSIFNKNLGHVIYAVGLTANFRARPYDTVRAHVSNLMDFFEHSNFESFLYLSSTRVYLKGKKADENADVRVNPNDPEDLYNLSKLMGESICFASEKPNVRVVRLSNVFGKKTDSSDFLSTVISDAVEKGVVFLKSGLESEKDYISIDDVVDLLPKIAVSGQRRLYNLASGKNVSHRQLLDEIQKITGCEIRMTEAAESTVFPAISIRRIQNEFAFSPTLLIPSLKNLIPEYELKVARD